MGIPVKLVIALAATAMAANYGSESLAQAAPWHVRDLTPAECPAIGMAKNGGTPQGRELILNPNKNRDPAPRPDQVNPNVTLAAMLAGGDDRGRFDERQGAEIVGYVTKVQQGGHPESANCQNMTKLYTDTHITVALHPDDPESASIVVEVTPGWRAKMSQQGVDRGTDTLSATILHRWVRFRGWLLFDTDHVTQAFNTAPNNPADWRKTVWEIHPITAMQMVQ